MKKRTGALAIMLMGAMLLSGCSKTIVQTTVAPTYFSDWVFSESNVKDGNSETAKWNLISDSGIRDSVWWFETGDATAQYSDIEDSFKGIPATIHVHFGTDLGESRRSLVKDKDGSSKMKIELNMTGDLLFIFRTSKLRSTKKLLHDIKILNATVSGDGTANLKVDSGHGEWTFVLPADAKKSNWESFLRWQSVNYVYQESLAYHDKFNVTSSNLNHCIWDKKVSKFPGENISPELKWDAVKGATKYVVVMLESYKLHMYVVTDDTFIAEGAYKQGAEGSWYNGPDVLKEHTIEFTVFVFALKNDSAIDPSFFARDNYSPNAIIKELDTGKDGKRGNIIAYGKLIGYCTNF